MATTITANGINFPDGSAGSPSIGGSDTNTGLFTGSDIVGFATGGSERLKIDASGNVNIANDSGKLQLGASADLQIYHDGSNSYIKDTGTGNLFVHSNQFDVLNADGSQYLLRSIGGASIELYEAGSKKFETTSDGVSIPSDTTFLQIGAGQDLDLHHNGTNSYIRNKTGDLHIRPLVAEEGIILKPNGAVELYYDGNKRLETTSAGIAVAGSIDVNDNCKLLIGDGDDLQIDHSGTNSQIYHNGTGHLYIATLGTSEDIHHQSTGKMTFTTGGSERLRITDDGIKFNGDTAAANALDDYEEGTWTPVYNPSGGASGVSYSAQVGDYVKIGRLVMVQFYMNYSASSSSGDVRISGLPFNPQNYGAGSVMMQYFGTDSDRWYVAHVSGNSNDFIHFYGTGNGSNWDSLSADNGAALLGTITYLAPA